MVRPVYVTGMVRYKPLLWHTSMYNDDTYYLPITRFLTSYLFICAPSCHELLLHASHVSYASLMSVLVHGQLKLPIHGRQKHPRTEGALARSAPSELRP